MAGNSTAFRQGCDEAFVRPSRLTLAPRLHLPSRRPILFLMTDEISSDALQITPRASPLWFAPTAHDPISAITASSTLR